jgi:transcriptional regulator of acetoin/glycerol metabolism
MLPPTTCSLAVGLKQLELQAIIDAIQLTHGNLKRAARELGIGRTSLYRKLHEFGLIAR